MSGSNNNNYNKSKRKTKAEQQKRRQELQAKKEISLASAEREKREAAVKEVLDANYPQASVPPKILELAALPVIQWFRLRGVVSADRFNKFLVVLHKEQEALALKHLDKEGEAQARTETEAGIAKYIRRANAAVHPDKHGDKYAQEYERLQEGRRVLGQEQLRRNYISCMVSVLRSFDEMKQQKVNFQMDHDNGSNSNINDREATVRKAHDIWWQNFEQEADQAATTSTTSKKNKDKAMANMAERVLQIEARHWQRCPGHLQVYKVNYQTRGVLLSFQVQILDWENFIKACRGIVLRGYQDNDVDGTIHERRIEGDRLSELLKKSREDADQNVCMDEEDRNYVVVGRYMQSSKEEVVLKVEHTLPSDGLWSLQWYALLQDENSGRMIQTSCTRVVRRDLTDPAVKQARHNLPRFQQLARQARSKLHRLIQQSTTTKQKVQPDALERQLWELHGAMGLAQLSLKRLVTALEILDLEQEAYSEIRQLNLTFHDAANRQSELDAILEVGRKRDTLRGFKKSVAAEIERGTLAEWIKTVQKSDLVNHGGEVNRLYQLLVEDKKAQSNTLYLDSTALTNASERTDLFSAKQCQVLQQRASLVAVEQEQEMERLLQQEEAQKAEEESRRLLEKQLANMPCTRGTCVLVDGLQQRPELNDKMGLFLGPHINAFQERWLIQVCGQEVALKRENFKILEVDPFDQQAPTKPPPKEETPVPEDDAPSPALPPVEAPTTAPKVQPSPAQPKLSTVTKSTTTKPKSSTMTKPTAAQPKSSTTAKPTQARPKSSTATAVATKTIPAVTDRAKAMAALLPQQNTASTAETTAAKCPRRPRREGNCTFIHNSIAAEFIGPRGRHIQALQDETKTKMKVENRPGTLRDGCWARVRVTSSSAQDAISKAMDLIEARYPHPYNIAVRPIAPARAAASTLQDFVPNPVASSQSRRVKPSSGPTKILARPPQASSAASPLKEKAEKAITVLPPQKQPLKKEEPSISPKQQSAKPQAPISARREKCSSPPGFGPVPEHASPAQPQNRAPPQPQNRTPPLKGTEQAANQGTQALLGERSSPSGVASITHSNSSSSWPKWDTAATDISNLGTSVADSDETATDTAPLNIQDLLSKNLLQDLFAPIPMAETSYNAKPDLMSVEEFLEANQGCLKIDSAQFGEWLQSLDVVSLEDLEDAVNDEDFFVEMQKNGLKGFKKATFKKAIKDAAADNVVKSVPLHDASTHVQNFIQKSESSPAANSVGLDASDLGPTELYCPISHELMVIDPVLAADGFTYERASITSWIVRKSNELDGNISGAILSPMIDQPLAHLELHENTTIRNMARDYHLKTTLK